jgi:large subunit ribosomal protein L15
MKYNELTLLAHRSPKRVGRGIAAGQGKTAGRGTKGQKSRTGSGKKPGFEGGQNPLAQRFPKLRGFTSHKTAASTVYTGQLDVLPVIIDNQVLADAGLVANAHVKVKVIAKGEVTKKHTVKLQGASAGAINLIQKAGGSYVETAQNARPASAKKADKKD